MLDTQYLCYKFPFHVGCMAKLRKTSMVLISTWGKKISPSEKLKLL